MSLAEAQTDGRMNGHSVPTIEYTELVEAQKAIDTELEAPTTAASASTR